MIPDHIRRFVLTSIPSVPYLEAALLFYHAPATTMNADELGRALYLDKQKAAALLEAMRAAGILGCHDEVSDRYRFEPRDEALRSALHDIAMVYPTNLIEVTNLIHDTGGKNARRFADAFKLRKATRLAKDEALFAETH